MAVDPRLSALVITKDGIEQSNSVFAQGGIAAVLDPADRVENHVEDTLIAGGALCDRSVVEMVVGDAPHRIAELIQWGTKFDRTGDHLALGREGGHSHERIAHALGDSTGREVMRAVTKRVRQMPNIDVWEKTFTIDLLTDDHGCCGALVWNSQHGKTLVWAKQTILCTGGAGQLYRETTNPEVGHRRRNRHRISGGGRAPRPGIHPIPSHGLVHRRERPSPDHRGHARRRGTVARPPRAPLHARLRFPGRTGPRATW